MTATEKWITDAGLDGIVLVDAWGEVESALLKPEYWQAVGKTRGWANPKECIIDGEEGLTSTTYQCVAVGFFQDVMDGLTIEEALTKIAT